MSEYVYVIMRSTFTKHGNDYYPYIVFASEEAAGKWLNDQPEDSTIEYEIEEVIVG